MQDAVSSHKLIAAGIFQDVIAHTGFEPAVLILDQIPPLADALKFAVNVLTRHRFFSLMNGIHLFAAGV